MTEDFISNQAFALWLKNCEDEYSTASGSQRLVVITEWNQFRSLDLKRLRAEMREPNIIDLRNTYEPETVKAAGFRYMAVGRA